MEEIKQRAVEAHNALMSLLQALSEAGADEQFLQALAQLVQAYRGLIEKEMAGGADSEGPQGPAGPTPMQAGAAPGAQPMQR